VLRLNRGVPHRAWHDDPRCGRCRKGGNSENGIPPDVTPAEPAPPPVTVPDLYASLTQLLTPPAAPAAATQGPAFREPGAGRGYGTYPAERTCPKCGTEWTLLVDRPGRQGRRSATCGPCRVAPMHRANALELPVGDQPGPWLFDGLCTQVDTDLFFPEKGGSTREAKAVCGRCPVLAECRDWAVATRQRYGVWGGLSERERRALVEDQAAS